MMSGCNRRGGIFVRRQGSDRIRRQSTGSSREIASVTIVLEWTLLLCPFLFGLFFPWGSAVVSVVLSTLLFLLLRQNRLRVSASPAFLTSASIILFHLGGMLWGTDRGMALVGAVQFLPLPLFVLLLEQFQLDARMNLLRRIPYAASVMVVLSFLLSRFVSLEGWFLVAGRQAGFFQYPNTYAVYLLFAVVLLLFGAPIRFGRLPWLIILLAGIALSGSRTVFVLLFGVLLVYLIREPSSKARLSVLLTVGLLLVSALLITSIAGKQGAFSRFLTISLSSSEFLGRLLYARDALPVILKHPLGLGYTGYRWLQGSFQTGVYSVQHVHNEFLQLLLDVGWVPAGLFLWALLRGLHSPQGGLCRRMLLAVLVLHCLLDFDTQFVSVAMLLFLVMDAEPAAVHPVKAPRITAGVLMIVSLLSLWIGAASFFYYLRKPSVAVKIDPGYTAALVDLLPSASEEEMGPLADRILRLNQSVAIAHDAKARSAFYDGNLEELVRCKQRALLLSRYSLREYLDTFDMLRLSYERSLQQGNTADAERCLELMHQIPAILETVRAQTSPLGWRIQDQPNLELTPDRLAWLRAHQ